MKKKKSTLFLLCGLPASGKSTFAHSVSGAEWLSSDIIREEFFGSEEIQFDDDFLRKRGYKTELKEGEKRKICNNIVFSTLYERARAALSKGTDVVLDATSINAVSRKTALDTLRGSYDKAICVWLDTPLEECKRRNAKRSRVVPELVLEQMATRFEPPLLSEGFDAVVTV